jgi:uncharacterized membrane protein
MGKGRVEAFSDGVIAIIITIMVLELKVPHDTDFAALRPLLPIFLSYVLSFVYLGIYWNNHHHLFQATNQINGRVLWANLHLLFWLSLLPFVTAWAGETYFAAIPVFCYGVVFLCAALAYFILTHSLTAYHGKDSPLAIAVGRDYKGKISLGLNIIAVMLALILPGLAYLLYTLVAILWFMPDSRIERLFNP